MAPKTPETAPAETEAKTRSTLAQASYDFDDVADIPTAATENPFVAPVQSLAGDYDDEAGRSRRAKAVRLAESEVGAARSRITKAAHGLATPRTAKFSYKDGVLTFWLRDKITHSK